MSKPRLTEITDAAELTALHTASIDAPALYSHRVGSRIHFWANAEELVTWRAWRDTQPTSGAAE